MMRHKSDDFVELATIAGLDPATDFQDADLRGVDFGTADISDFNFARANLEGANFSQAQWTKPPFWADDWGIDEYSRWVSFGVLAADGKRVAQRMRWIPSGRFMMGSPDDEVGRHHDEGPCHEVTLADGFWLFDTPCTQALWSAVMGDNPSHFRSPTRPVEQVSFTDVRAFLRKLNGRVPGLSLGLPSEAQWEYACRAGTIEATYGEPLEAIAWHAANAQDGTQPVGRKAVNRWGLYDMLGNVWEWCADNYHSSYDGAPNDGSAWIGGKSTDRVFRGGSWLGIASGVRAGSRNAHDPANRDTHLGFRCAWVPSAGELANTKWRAGRNKPNERSKRAATTSPKPEIGGSSIDRKRQKIVSALARHLGTRLIGKKGFYFESPDHRHRIVCTVSKRHEGRRDPYWYRYEPNWHDFLAAQSNGHLVLGGMDIQFAFAIPASVIGDLRDQLHTTMDGDRVGYWHLNITETTPGNYALALRNAQSYPLDGYRFELE
jgi:formylglycine-generating enzyme required for sulfatase activity